MNKTTYFQLVSSWERLYGVPSRAFKYDPADVKTCCEKCQRMPPKMSRHHKANDFFFAMWFPDIFAADYIQFRKEDCAKLCNRCHISVERFYESVKQELYADFNARGGVKWVLSVDKEEARAWAIIWRAKFITLFDRWLKKPIRKRKNPRQRKKARRLAAKHEGTK